MAWPQFSPKGDTLVFGEGVALYAARTPLLNQKPDWSIHPVQVALGAPGSGAAYSDPSRWARLTDGAYWLSKSSGGSTFALRLLPDGRTVRELSAASGGASLGHLDAVTGKLVRKTLTAPKFARLYIASFSPDGTLFAFGREDGRTEVWSVDRALNLRRVVSFPGQGQVSGTVFSPDGRRVASLRETGISVFDLAKQAEVGSFTGLRTRPTVAAFNSPGTLLAVSSGTTSRGGTATVLRVAAVEKP